MYLKATLHLAGFDYKVGKKPLAVILKINIFVDKFIDMFL